MRAALRRLVQPFFNLPIGIKLILGYSAAFTVALAIEGIVIDTLVRRTLAANVERELNNSTTAILNMVRTTADVAIRSYLRAVAEKSEEVVAGFHEQARLGLISEAHARSEARIALLSQTIGNTGYIYCIDSEGVIRVHPDEDMVGRNISRYDFIQLQKERRTGYLKYDWRNPGEPAPRPRALYMSYFAPWDWIISVSSFRDEFRQLLDLEDLREQLTDLRFGRTGYSFILDTYGRVVVQPPGTPTFTEPELLWRIARQHTGELIMRRPAPGKLFGREQRIIFHHLPELSWIVASVGYPDEFSAPLNQVQRIIVATIGLSLLLVFPLSFFLASLITRPVRRLKRSFAAGATGDFTVRVEGEAHDEIGDLARYFNSFMEKLQEFERSLRSEKEELERRVAARTAELQESLEVVRRAQAQLVQSEKMAALGAMVSWVAHEINTPVGIGVTAASHLEERTRKMETLLREERLRRSDMEGYMRSAVESAGILQANLRRAAELIRSFKQVAVDQASEEQRRFDLGEYLEEIITSLQPRLRQSPHRIRVNCPPGLVLDSYPGAFSQIVTNLVINSLVHAFPEGTRGEMLLDVRREDGTLCLEYTDDGRGIEPEVLPHIFEPFFTTRRGQGAAGWGCTSSTTWSPSTSEASSTSPPTPARGPPSSSACRFERGGPGRGLPYPAGTAYSGSTGAPSSRVRCQRWTMCSSARKAIGGSSPAAGNQRSSSRSSPGHSSPPTGSASSTTTRVCSAGARKLETTLRMERISTRSPVSSATSRMAAPR